MPALCYECNKPTEAESGLCVDCEVTEFNDDDLLDDQEFSGEDEDED